MSDALPGNQSTKISQLKVELDEYFSNLFPQDHKQMFFVTAEPTAIDIRVRTFYPDESLYVHIIRLDMYDNAVGLTIWLKVSLKGIHETTDNMGRLCTLEETLQSFGLEEVTTSEPGIFALQCEVSHDELVSTLIRALEIITAH